MSLSHLIRCSRLPQFLSTIVRNSSAKLISFPPNQPNPLSAPSNHTNPLFSAKTYASIPLSIIYRPPPTKIVEPLADPKELEYFREKLSWDNLSPVKRAAVVLAIHSLIDITFKDYCTKKEGGMEICWDLLLEDDPNCILVNLFEETFVEKKEEQTCLPIRAEEVEEENKGQRGKEEENFNGWKKIVTTIRYMDGMRIFQLNGENYMDGILGIWLYGVCFLVHFNPVERNSNFHKKYKKAQSIGIALEQLSKATGDKFCLAYEKVIKSITKASDIKYVTELLSVF